LLTHKIRFFFDLILVPAYRWYSLLGKKISEAAPAANNISEFFAGRLTIHIFVTLIAVVLVYSNIFLDQGVVSSDELVGKTKLAAVIGQASIDSDPMIEDYPNLEIARLERHLNLGKHSLFGSSSILTKEQAAPETIATTNNSSPRTELIAYTVQNGDTISRIAQRFKISVNTILWANDLKATSLIKPGDQLDILPTSGVPHSSLQARSRVPQTTVPQEKHSGTQVSRWYHSSDPYSHNPL
jgi:LysM repeat protein